MAIFSTRVGARQKYESHRRARAAPVLCAGLGVAFRPLNVENGEGLSTKARGNCEPQFYDAWDCRAGGCRSSLCAGSAARQSAGKKDGRQPPRRAPGEGSFLEEMTPLALRG